MHSSTARALIPDGLSDDIHHDRFHHRDLETLTPMELFSERTLLTAELARRVFKHKRETVIHAIDGPVTDRAWIVQRLERLAAEEQRRTRGRIQ